MTQVDEGLSPCPFCRGAMMFRKALNPSDGNVDAIIHAFPTGCPMGDFLDGTIDESIIGRWNTRSCTPPDSAGVKPFDLNDPRPIWEQGRPDWQQDQAETSVLPRTPSPSAEPVAWRPNAEQLIKALRTAFRRFGGIPAIARSEAGAEKIISICVNEIMAFSASPVSDARGREALIRALQGIRDERYNENADLDAICNTAEQALRSFSSSFGKTGGGK